MASLKSEIDQLDIGKLETTPIDLSKLTDIVKNEVVKRDVYYKFVTTNLVKKTDYDKKIGEIEKKITDHGHNNK